MIPDEDMHYSEDHEWIKESDNGFFVGITEYAEDQMGDITYLELPELGVSLEQNEEMGVIESIKTAADLYAPVAGVVAEVNTVLEEMPETINRDPYEDGWICRLVDVNPKSVKKLMTAKQYKEFLLG